MSDQTDPMAGYPFVITQPVGFRDLDGLGHVNHAVYLTYFEAARLAYYTALTGRDTIDRLDIILVEIGATYHAPASFGDELRVGVRISRVGTKSFDMEYLITRPRDGQRIASGRSVQVGYDYAAGRSAALSDAFRAQVAARQDG